MLQEFLDKKILVTKDEQRPVTKNSISISFGSFGPIEVPENEPVKEKKRGFIIVMKDEKKKACNMIEEKKTNLGENIDPMEVEVMNTRSRLRYGRIDGKGV